MRILAATGGAAALLISMNGLQAEPFLYAAASGQLVKVDVGLGTTTVVGAFNQPGCYAIAISPQGQLFTATYGAPAAVFYIDLDHFQPTELAALAS